MTAVRCARRGTDGGLVCRPSRRSASERSMERMPIRVLVVDDDHAVRELLRLYLERSGRCVVVGEGCDGHDAIRLAGDLKPDVVVLDIAMPGLSGLDALPTVRRVAPRARILMYTGHAPVERSFAVERGADDFCQIGRASCRERV